MTEEAHLMDAAEFAGEHAFSLFLAALFALLLATALIWRLAQRYAMPSERSRLPPAAFLALHLSIGFAVIVGAGAVFAEIADELGAEEELGELDEAFTAALSKSVSMRTAQAFAALTHLGDTITLTVLCIAVAVTLIVRGGRWLALAWTLAVAGNAVLNTTLKLIFQRARPIHDAALVAAEGWSFPSGHASGAVVSYGMLAYVLMRQLPSRWHLPVVLTAAAVAFATGCSRVFLRVHFPSDVVAGFASGALWLAVCIGSVELSRYYRRTRRHPSML